MCSLKNLEASQETFDDLGMEPQMVNPAVHTKPPHKHTRPGAAYRGSKVRSGADDTQLYDFSPHEICKECLP